MVLGRTLPSLLDEAVERNPNPRALRQRAGDGWQVLGTRDLRDRARNLALGLLGRGLRPGDRVAFYVRSDLSFCLADMACLVAGLVNVPLYLEHTPGAIRHILGEAECRALVVSDGDLLHAFEGALPGGGGLELVATWDGAGARGDRTVAFATLEAEGAERERAEPGAGAALAARRRAGDVATILYTSGTTGLPKGVVLTHENLSFDVVAAFTGLHTFLRGDAEEVLSFLPLTHIFARTLHYGLLWYGSSVTFCEPAEVPAYLREVRPTFFASVPRVLEKAYDRIEAAGAALRGPRRVVFDLALRRAARHRPGRRPRGLDRLVHRALDALVYRRWRDALGGRLHTVIVGGAALRGDLATVFAAAGVDVLQGYGLTETSPVIAFNRPDRHRPGTVGPVLAGTEVRIGDDGEVLARGPHVMQGYYRQPELTAEALEPDGWFHTGDVGELDADGYLRITGRLKHLFKLSTGKYVMPAPIEERLARDPLVATALVLGEGHKYCTALVFAERDALAARADGDPSEALGEPEVREAFARAVAEANRDMPAWSSVKRFALLADELTVEGGGLTPKLSVRREAVLRRYDAVVAALYAERIEPGPGPLGACIVEVAPPPGR